jgi:hypothetical protein
LPYQQVIAPIRAVIEPAERSYLDFQPRLEKAASEAFRQRGPKAAGTLLTAYASDCATRVGAAYSELVDDLMLRFLVGDPEFARPALARISAPTVPRVEPPVAP